MKPKVQDSLTPQTLTPVDFDPFGEGSEPVRFPLTEGQREIWASVQMGREASSAYNQCFPLCVRGRLLTDAMRTAIQLLVARHEALRVVCDPQGETQTVLPTVTLDIPVTDLTGQKMRERDAAVAARLHNETQEPFDLAQGPLVRAQIIKETQDCHLIVLTVHHIVSDGWSTAILLKDLAALYEAECFGIRAQMPEAGRFSDYARHQLTPEYQTQGAAAERYWRTQFADSVPVLEFALDRPRPPIKTYNCAQQRLSLDATMYLDLKRVAAKQGCTLYTLLLAGFQTLVHRLTGQTDFVVGIPAAGQALSGENTLIGHGTNLLPLRTTINPRAPFAAYLREVRDKMLDALEHQAVTFGSLVRILNPPRDSSRTPLVATTFNVDKIEIEFPFQSVTSELLPSPKRFATFEVEFNIQDTGTELVVECNHNTDLFNSQTISRWLTHYQVLLQGIVENPSSALATLPLLSDAEHEYFQTQVSSTVAYPRSICLHQLFEAQVQRTPEAIAVSYNNETLSYNELNKRANILAHRLRSLGVGPDVIVALCVDRSLEMAIGILGILKAGGAYLPVDPMYPKDRLTFMLEDAQVSVLVTQEKLTALFPATDSTQILLDGFASVDMVATGGNQENPTCDGIPDNLAYVIYTSGSTGKPKGVLITHYNVVRLFEATDAWFHFGPADVWTLFHSFAFDFSVWELWGPLLRGGRLVIVPYLVSRSPEAFYALLKKEHVTVLNQTPSAFRQLIQAEEQSAADPEELELRLIIFGGEALELQSLRPWFDRHGDTRPQLVNMYGITETTVHVTYRPITKADLESQAGSVIGIPIPDLQIFILDPNGQRAPVGVVGEIYVGGAGLARGYLNRPELTSERFVPNTFVDHSGSRLYRSGDLARYLSDGDLEYLGRIDLQVKIRGYRIELGEIEAVLAQHLGVRETVVLTREDNPGDKKLVAYLVGSQDSPPIASDLRDHLRKVLPEYMIPSAFVVLPTLPHTLNGKIDRKLLPLPDQIHRALERTFVIPQTPTEKTLSEVWSKVLGVEQIGVHDNFFDLGGHSILAAQLVSQLRKIFGVELPVHNVFRAPTVAEFATMLEAVLWSNQQSEATATSADRVEIDL